MNFIASGVCTISSNYNEVVMSYKSSYGEIVDYVQEDKGDIFDIMGISLDKINEPEDWIIEPE